MSRKVMPIVLGMVIAGGSGTILSGIVPTGMNLERHLKAEASGQHEPKIHNDDYIYGPYIPFIDQYKGEITAAGQQYRLPVELIAGTIVSENYGRKFLDEAKEAVAFGENLLLCPYTGWCVDQSIGVGQIKLSTAAYLNTRFGNKEKTREQLREELEDPAKNIEYIAMTLADIMHRPNRQTDAENVFADPHLVAVVGTEYVRGPTETPLAIAEPSGEGAWFAYYVANIPSLRIFGDDATINRADQNVMRNYAKKLLHEHHLQ